MKGCNDKDLMMNVTNSMTVMQLKKKLLEKYGINPEEFILTYSSRWLKDDDDLRDISANSTIFLTNRLRGGFSSFGVDMADIANEKGLVKKNYNKNAPKWNIIDKELNL